MRPTQNPPSPLPPAPAEDEFRYGWRYVKRLLPDGSVDFDQVPLTLEDVLHPEEEDCIPVRPVHEMDCAYLAHVFRTRDVAGPPVTAVTADLRIDWGVEGLRAHSPDVAVFAGLKHPPALQKGTMYLAEVGGECLLAVEVVSPDTRNNDAVVKVEHYHRARVRLYVLIDQETADGPRSIVAYRWTPARLEPTALDEAGQLLLAPLGLLLTMRDNRPVCIDRDTSKQLGDYQTVARELDEADARNAENERALEEAALTHRALEARVTLEAEGRAKAEEQAKLEAEGRAKAEKEARAFQAQLQQMQELLARLQAGADPAGH